MIPSIYGENIARNFIGDKFIIISRSHGAPEKSSIGIKRDVRLGKPQALETWITRDKFNIRIALELQFMH